MSEKPNCYECIHKGDVPGSAHSSCHHPKAPDGGSLARAFAIMGGGPEVATSENALNVKGHPQGIKGGWFSWPYNFDPVWLQSCDGYEQKGDA